MHINISIPNFVEIEPWLNPATKRKLHEKKKMKKSEEAKPKRKMKLLENDVYVWTIISLCDFWYVQIYISQDDTLKKDAVFMDNAKELNLENLMNIGQKLLETNVVRMNLDTYKYERIPKNINNVHVG